MTNDAKYIYVPICHPYIFFGLMLIQTSLYTSICIKWYSKISEKTPYLSLIISFILT